MKYLINLLLLVFVSCSSSSSHKLSKGRIAIATQGQYSTKAGFDIVDQGGNIFDAFAAISFAQAVERPQSTGIAGGGFAMVYLKSTDRVVAYDFRETAPLKASEKMYQGVKGEVIPNASVDGARAVAVPGLVKGVIELHKLYGKLGLTTVMKPAIDLAEKGFPVYAHLANAINKRADVLKQYGGSKIFFHADGTALKEGDLLRQPELAESLRQIATQGEDVFYKGDLGKKIVKDLSAKGGIISMDDLDTYEIKARNPVMSFFQGYQLFSMSPPSSGGIHVLEILNIIDHYPVKNMGPQSSEYLHLLASAMQIAFADRAKYLGDPEFVNVPTSELISRKHAGNALHSISLKRATPSSALPSPQMEIKESNDTVHFSLMDNEGNVISSTQTINGLFGSGFVAEGTGIVMNNEMDDFTVKVGAQNIFGAVGGKKNIIAPIKRPLSSMSPTIVFRQGKPMMALGSPSGTRIISCVAQVLINTLLFNEDLDAAISAPRIHHQWYPDSIMMEPGRFNEQVKAELRNYGHQVADSDLGCRVQAVIKKDGKMQAVSDPRGEGLAEVR